MAEIYSPFLDTRTGCTIGFDGRGWNVTTDILDDPESAADISGPDIGFVMPLAGWEFADTPFRAVAWDQDRRIVAVGWASHTLRQGVAECNLTYAVDSEYRGKGLASLVTSAAIVYQAHSCIGSTDIAWINVQCRESNTASANVATSLGLSRDTGRDFVAALPDGRTLQYVGFSAPFSSVVETAQARLISREQTQPYSKERG